MATAGSIVVDLLMRTGSFETDTKRAERRMKQMSREIDRTARSFRRFLGATVGITGFVAAIKSATSYMSEMGTAAERTSISTKAFTELNYAAEVASLSTGELTRILRRASEAVTHAADGTGKQAKALEALGVSAYNSTGRLKTADEMLRDLADKFSQLEGGARKTQLAMDVFGTRLGQNVIPLLNMGSDGLDEMAKRAHDLGLVIDDEAAQAAIDFEQNLKDLKSAGRGLAITLAENLVPALNSTITKFNEAAKAGGGFYGFLASAESALLGGEGYRKAESLIAEQQQLVQRIERIQDDLAAGGAWEWLDKRALRYNQARLAVVEEELKRVLGESSADQVYAPDVPRLPSIPVTPDDTKDSRSRARVEIDAGQKLIDQMVERIALLGKETEYEKMLAQIQSGRYNDLLPWQKEAALDLARQIDVQNQQIETERTLKALREQQSITQRQFMRDLESFGQSDSVRELNNDLARVEDRYRSIIDARRNSPLGLSDDELAQIRESLEIELEMVREFHILKKEIQEDWKLGAVKAVHDYVEEAENLYQSMGGVVTNALQGMENALVDFAMTGKASFGDLANSVVKDMIRMTVQAMILAPLMRAIGFSGGGFVGVDARNVVGGSLGSADGATWGFSADFSSGGYTGDGGKYEPAGIVHKGEGVLSQEEIRALGGEAGFNALRRAIRGPSHAVGGLGGRPSLPPLPAAATGAGSVNVTVNVSDKGGTQVNAPAGMENMAREIGQFVEAKIREHEARSQRQGGVAWQARQGAFA